MRQCLVYIYGNVSVNTAGASIKVIEKLTPLSITAARLVIGK